MYFDIALEYILSAVDVALVLFFVSRFIDKVKVSKLWLVAFVAIQTIINNVTGAIVGEGNLLGLLLMIATTGLLYKLVFEEGIVAIYAYTLLAMIFVFLTETVGVLAVMMFGMMPTDIHTNLFAKLLGYSVSKVLFFVIILYFVPKMKVFKRLNRTSLYQILLVCMFNIIIIFMSYWFYQNTDSLMIKEHATRYILLTTFGAVLFSFGIVSILRGLIKQSQREAEWLVKENEYKRQMFYLDNIQGMLKSIKAQRHDFNNHINCLYGLIKMEKTKEVQSYIEKLAEEASKFNQIIDTGNPVLTALLNTKITTAETNRIQLATSVQLPEKLEMEPLDISIIIGNLLDNALEACLSEDVEDKKINLEVYTNSGNLIIKLLNAKSGMVTVDLSKLDRGYTSKADAFNHGFGLANIKQTVNKYGGIVKFEDKGKSFASNIAIPLKI